MGCHLPMRAAVALVFCYELWIVSLFSEWFLAGLRVLVKYVNIFWNPPFSRLYTRPSRHQRVNIIQAKIVLAYFAFITA